MSATGHPSAPSSIRTAIASSDETHIVIRGHDLAEELLGRVTFTEMVFLVIAGRMPTPTETRVLDAVLVTLVDHGLTPSALAARLTYAVAPEAVQAAVAAGLLGAGSKLLGSMEETGSLLTRIDEEVAAGEDATLAIERVVAEYRKAGRRLPGLGHPVHRGGDPRTQRLFAIATEAGVGGRHIARAKQLEEAAERALGRRLPLNATGAIAALLLELGIPWHIHRGFALISRTAGLVAHIDEERKAPITPAVNSLLHEASRPKDA